mmetsp:Transcript_40462/g.64904  ORF Transcript_40462/g.64904 Transcript_40462/m.64904 type:complete len:226 (-) Transcript_40462:488-1165(-)
MLRLLLLLSLRGSTSHYRVSFALSRANIHRRHHRHFQVLLVVVFFILIIIIRLHQIQTIRRRRLHIRPLLLLRRRIPMLQQILIPTAGSRHRLIQLSILSLCFTEIRAIIVALSSTEIAALWSLIITHRRRMHFVQFLAVNITCLYIHRMVVSIIVIIVVFFFCFISVSICTCNHFIAMTLFVQNKANHRDDEEYAEYRAEDSSRDGFCAGFAVITCVAERGCGG